MILRRCAVRANYPAMSGVRLDPRLNAFSPELADSRLRGLVDAARFVEGRPMRVAAASAPLRRHPSPDAPWDSELLHGEAVRVFDDTVDGWSWVQNEADGYVGFVRSDSLAGPGPEPTHRIVALRTFVYPGPDMKLPAVMALTFGTRLVLGEETETRGTRYRLLAGSHHAVVASHVASLALPPEADYVAVAERFLNVPYLWGGRTSLGLDCSALVQLALMAAGVPSPRDTDMQRDRLGSLVEGGIGAVLRRGDLVFWPGHVAILAAPDRIVHASGHHMTVVSEPLAAAVARIGAVAGPPTAVKRLEKPQGAAAGAA
ncbi:MAG TPA: NlpC/P60 family protein [Bauldia sp.]|nr:NlpC/P60 family protein [Bauldia sp.]